MDPFLLQLGIAAVVIVVLVAVVWIAVRLASVTGTQDGMPLVVGRMLEEKHLAMLKDLNDGLNTLGDRLASSQGEAVERLRVSVSQELKQARDTLAALQLDQTEQLSANRETMSQKLSGLGSDFQLQQEALRTELVTKVLETLAQQSRAEQELIQSTLTNVTQQLTGAIESLTKTVDGRLEQISGRVTERLDEGFKKTNETFTSVMTRLATIDEAQKKIDGLTTNVVSLQELLGDKRSRGAFGEVQLEALVRNILPPSAYEFQSTLSNGNRADCVLKLPEPTGAVAVDSKFPLENYQRMFETGVAESERLQAQKQFRVDVRKHIDDIASKYIIHGETSDGAVMFVPAEAVFAEIHAYHSELVDFAMQRRVWIVSPTTMMAVLNTARAVLKDVETRHQVHIIKDELAKLGKDFGRFDQRLRQLADHIRQAHEDTEKLRVTGDKLTRRFAQIERVELEQPGSLAQLEGPATEAETDTAEERQA